MANQTNQRAEVAAPQRAGMLPPAAAVVREVNRFTRRKPLGAIGGLLVLVLVIVALMAPVLAPYGARELPDSREGGSTVYIPPNSQFLLGTDHVGRDVLSRLIYGARISLYVGLGSVLIGITASFIIGVALAYAGGIIDMSAQRVVDALMALPGLIIALAIVAVLGSSLNNVILAIVIGMIAPVIRTVRSQVLSIKELDYVTAAQAIGAPAVAHRTPAYRAQLLRHLPGAGDVLPWLCHHHRGLPVLPGRWARRPTSPAGEGCSRGPRRSMC